MSPEFVYLKVGTRAFLTVALVFCDILGEILFAMSVGLWFCLFWGFCFCFTEILRVFPFNHFYAQLLKNGGRSTRKQKGQIYILLGSFTTIFIGTRISSEVSVEVFLLSSQILL